MFSKFVGKKDSNEAEVLGILEALGNFSGTFNGQIVVESDSFIECNYLGVYNCAEALEVSLFFWRDQAFFSPVASWIPVRWTNSLVDDLANRGCIGFPLG